MLDVKSTRDFFQRLPNLVAVAIAALPAIALSLVTGLAAAFVGIYLYDSGRSKGDDLAVGISVFCAVGTFVFVTTLSGLATLHHKIDWRTPEFALAICLVVIAFVTWMWSDGFAFFILAGWAAVAVCGLLALAVSGRFVGTER
jgi:hypothetical protein